MSTLNKLASIAVMALLLTAIHQPIAAAPRIAPIVSNGYLLGGSVNGKWVDGATTARQLRGVERYRIYTSAGQLGTSTGAAKAMEVICRDTWQVEFKPQPSAAEFGAIGGTHNPLPRKPRLHSPNTAVYRQAIANLLRSRGIANPEIRITKIVRIDLEGDGVDEVVISATRLKHRNPAVDAGDYSLVVLRKLSSGKVQTIPIAENYYPKAQDFVAPHEFSVPAIVDANGDGKLEILVNWHYYEGSGAELYTVQGSRVSKVLSSGCGV